MWRDRIIETKKAKGITVKTMSEVSLLPVETITRILNSKTEDPRISTVLGLGRAVGLTEHELFADQAILVSYQGFLALQAEYDTVKAERDALQVAHDELKSKVESLRDKIDSLKDDYIALLTRKHHHENPENH